MTHRNPDVLIVGGGVIGSAIAYFLSTMSAGRGLRISVLEPDPSYATSSTALSVGGVRHQFSTRENILLSLFASEFFRQASEILDVEGHPPELGFVEGGYLFLATQAGSKILESNLRLQQSLGADVRFLDPGQLRTRFPWLEVHDLAGGGLGLSGEGWVDPFSLLQAFRKKAISQGVEYLKDRLVGLEVEGDRITRASLESGLTLAPGVLVNAAGPRASEVVRMAGIRDFPVHPRKRFVYQVHCPEKIPPTPLTIDPSGVYFRPEGPDFLCGVSPPPENDPDALDLDVTHGLFDEMVWPALAHRVPAFERLKLTSAWAGHYAVNVLDRNAILGPHPRIPNFLLANGFSGHGLQHAPGVGRGLAEWIMHGRYESIDLTPFGFHRVDSGAAIREENVV